MTLAAGTKLGPYEVLAPIGSGGMGEVYQAQDSRLGRKVALKILRENLSTDDQHRSRFLKRLKLHPRSITRILSLSTTS
jgi:eukaryotic-like serine/threonine-protein kinase